MTKKEAKQLLITSSQRCNHATWSDVVYRRRLYPLCKTCFLLMMRAMSVINDKANPFAISKEQEYPSVTFVYGYTVHTTDAGYQPEIFHIWNEDTIWVGNGYATKQRAYDAADRYLVKFHRLCAPPNLKRLMRHASRQMSSVVNTETQ